VPTAELGLFETVPEFGRLFAELNAFTRCAMKAVGDGVRKVDASPD